MTIPQRRAEPGAVRRGIAAALTAAVLLSVTAYVATATMAVTQMRAVRSGALLGDLRSERAAQLDSLSPSTVRTAVAAEPLDGRTVNIAMARDVRQHGTGNLGAWLSTLSRLGWRDTTSLQNRLYMAARAGDMGRILDISDALLRRQQMMEQVVPVLALVEADPALRPTLARRLAANPRWRGLYLGSTDLRDRDQLTARYDLLGRLQAQHVDLDRSEVVPSILALDRAGMSDYGFRLWQRFRPRATRPLDDTRFEQASSSYQDGQDIVPYQWRVMNGEGFSAEAVRDGDRTMLSIDWSGRGIPTFAEQRTTGGPGMYALNLDVPPEEKADLPALVFRLSCGEDGILFEPVGGDPIRLRTVSPIPCSYPLLQIAGDIQSSVAAHQITINRIVLRSLGAPPAVR